MGSVQKVGSYQRVGRAIRVGRVTMKKVGRVTREWAVCIQWAGRPESKQGNQRMGRETRDWARETREWPERSIKHGHSAWYIMYIFSRILCSI